MIDIRKELEKIENGRWGFDIRYPIYSALETIANYYNYGIGEIVEEDDDGS